MLTFEDLLAAKVAVQMGLLDGPAVRAGLVAAQGANRTFVQELEAQRRLDAAVARTVAGHARKCNFLKAESVYLSFLRKRGGVDVAMIEKVRARQRAEGLRLRLGDLLVADGAIPKAVDQELLAKARESFIADNAAVTERYAAKGFEGIEKPSVTVSEVIGQVAGDNPADSKFPGGPGDVATPAAAIPRASVPTRLPAAPRPMGTDPAGDLAALGHSAEIALPPRPGTGVGMAVPMATPPPASRPFPAAPAAPPSTRPARPAAPPPPPSARPAPVAPELAGTGLETKYDFLKKVGEGGMGAVYLVREKGSGREVALKLVLDREKSKEAAQRFKREILATSMCDHENVIQIFDAGELKDGHYFMAMEYVAGEELSDIVKREGAIALPRALDLFEQILEGIAAVHTAGIVHRDLKPQNFRVWKDPATGKERVKIMDFGIARVQENAQFSDQFYKTMGGKITGSPAYIAPESITEPTVDHRADLYSLGIALFRMVTGKLPFSCKDPMEYLPKHLYTKPPVPSEFVPALKIPRELDSLILRLLEKMPEQRYAKAEDVLADLRMRVRPALGGPKAAPVEAGFTSAETLNMSSAEATRGMPAHGGVATPGNVMPATIAMGPPGHDVAATINVPPPGSDMAATINLPPPDPEATVAGNNAPIAPSEAATLPPGAVRPEDLKLAPKPVAKAPQPEGRGCLGFLFGKKKT